MRALAKAAAVQLMGFDVDGVLTDGRLWFGPEGETLKAFDSQDGHGLKLLAQAGVTIAIVTGRRSEALLHRARNLGVELLAQGVEDKVTALHAFAAQRQLSLAQCGYMGDDTVDLPVLRACGFSATVAGGHAEVKREVDYVARLPGGRGAVREVCDLLVRARGGRP